MVDPGSPRNTGAVSGLGWYETGRTETYPLSEGIQLVGRGTSRYAIAALANPLMALILDIVAAQFLIGKESS